MSPRFFKYSASAAVSSPKTAGHDMGVFLIWDKIVEALRIAKYGAPSYALVW